MFRELLLLINITALHDVTLSEQGLDIARDLRSVTSTPLVITSNCRTKEKNKKVGGIINSKHLSCEALDIRIKDLDRETINNILSLNDINKYDIVIEHNPPHIHIER